MRKPVALVLGLTLLSIGWNFAAATPPIDIAIDGRQVLNQNANQVGIWLDSRQDGLSDELIAALDRLRIRSVRYGWAFALFDPDDLRTQQQSPRDSKTDGFFTDGKGRMGEKIGPRDVGQLLTRRQTPGFAVLGTDGIRYIGKEDKLLAAMTPSQRIDLYAARAAEWANWGRDQNFEYFEIGNENDISGHGQQEGIIEPWTPEAYASVAARYVDAIKSASPEAKCGINGGLIESDKSRQWFQSIADAEPALRQKIDFLVAHKYEMWLDAEVWQAHADWTFGRVQSEVREARQNLFPDAEIHVTELGSWKTGEIDHHYRSLLATEMLGNVYMDPSVRHVQFWPTRWATEGGVFRPGGYELSPMGLGLAMYSRFAQPILFANDAKAGVRYFASRGSETGLSVWFINHADQPRTFQCNVSNVDHDANASVFRLISPSGVVDATDSTVRKEDAIAMVDDHFTIDLPPLSATVVAF